jgi:Txe/YoeB family toxin of Txe-Axe toxin-antitoxin module
MYRYCKGHYLDYLKQRIRKELRLVYRDPESAYAALDFAGTGKI